MSRSAARLHLAAIVAALCSGVRAQQPAALPVTTPQIPQQPAQPWRMVAPYSDGVDRDDYHEVRAFGGFRFIDKDLGIEIRGANALMLLDLDGWDRATKMRKGNGKNDGIPHRDIPDPDARRRLSAAEVRARLDHTLRAIGKTDGLPESRSTDLTLDLLQYMYCEGGVVVVRDGIEVLRCDRFWMSPLEDRVVVENAELRYLTPGRRSNEMMVVRGPRLERNGTRWTGRDVTLTTCSAGEPHAATALGEVEIIEREGEFEIVTHGSTLMIGGTKVLPLPDTRIFTKSQSEFPIRRASAGYSGKEGWQSEVAVGLPWNTTGGKLHQWLTGRPADEFRGEWELGVGYNEARGVPLDGSLNYRVPGLYEGRTEGFALDDHGDNLREIQNNLDGSPIGGGSRSLLRTQNRVQLGDSTHLDLVAFRASDPAVYSEFFAGPYRNEEVPESGLYLHHADGNQLLTIGTRSNLDDFSYRDNRALADGFTEELPVVTYQWLAQPIAHLPWGTALIADLETDIGERRTDFNAGAINPVSDQTLRADQLAELSAPFHMGPLNVRPYVNARGTFYDQTVAGGSDGRIAFEGGMQIGTRMSRTWTWFGDEGERSVRHVIAPRVTWRNRFYVDDNPDRFYQFDAIDQISEQQLVRVEVRNLLQTMEPADGKADGPKQPRDFVYLDLAQDLWPEADRDNAGHGLGLLHYDLRLRPQVHWLPFENFSFAIFGDHDWQQGLRTLDTEMQLGKVLGVVWTADYRTDQFVRGAVGVTGSTKLLGRWDVYAHSQRDIERDAWLNYSFGLRRNDHDWSVEAGAVYDPFSNQTTFRIEFLPRFGGMNGGHHDRFGGIDPRNQFATSY